MRAVQKSGSIFAFMIKLLHYAIDRNRERKMFKFHFKTYADKVLKSIKTLYYAKILTN